MSADAPDPPDNAAPQPARSDRLTPAPGLRLRRCRHGLMLFRSNDVFIGRSLELYGEMNELELKVQCALIRPGDVVCDVGANIGVNTIALARRAGEQGRVIAFEPQRLIHQMLCANVALNGLNNVVAFWAAVGENRGEIRVPAVNYARPGNFGGVALGGPKDASGERVRLTTIDELQLARCRLIKIDVEGMELDVLMDAARTIERLKPRLYFENNRKERSPALLGHVLDLGYRLYWHMSALYNPDNFAKVERNIFPGIVSVDVIGLPPGDKLKVERMRPIASPQDWWQRG